MKKGLSVLLIVAALFGFYGGAVNLQDVLACMHYWEKEGERTTADMNKLEDGLKQLQDNEQAYLDGVKTVEEGEVKLADAEGQLATGRKDLAAGAAKLVKGEKDLATAIKNRAALANVRSKISASESAYDPWLKKFNKMKASIVDNPDNPKKGVLFDAGATAVALSTINAAFGDVKTIGDEGFNTLSNLTKIPVATLKSLSKEEFAAMVAGQPQEAALIAGFNNAKDALDLYGYLSEKYSMKLLAPAGSIQNEINTIKDATYQATALRKSKLHSYAADAEAVLNELLADTVVQAAAAKPAFAEKAAELVNGVNLAKSYAKAAQTSTSDYNNAYDQLVPGKATKIGKAVARAAKAILSNKDIKSKLTLSQQSALKPYTSSSSITGLPNVELLYATMTLGTDAKDDGKGSLLDNFRTISGAAYNGLGLYDDGIADGKAKLAKGYKDYDEGAAKLADGEAQYSDGVKALADGKAQLAQYEDGEQQVRDGLATLMSTEPSGGLESILDRRSGDDDFDNGDEHLDLAEGLEAVDVGRGYQADSGDLITAELVKRGAGTAAGIAAGVLALLAALLSFLKKNKGAAISACIAAIAAAGGAAVGTSAGTEFSVQAGSAVGVLPWAAAGVLAAVAVVFAVVHFSAPKEAK